ncbi:10487_t:CDS:2 [Gigaspora margarita]|uniref:10487_t:CDS:1 n=1 Tax=Gigaspora margarita TaxID=4874 RepID=A0ABM8VWP1_GIGMA|nr:10487_t:CDS:2 [Gigaspora margarita]
MLYKQEIALKEEIIARKDLKIKELEKENEQLKKELKDKKTVKKIKVGLLKFRAKMPTKFHPQIDKMEGLLAALSKELSGTEKNTLDLNFCESCWKEWGLRTDELEQTFKNKYSEAEKKEIERKFKEIDKEGEKLLSDFAEEVGKERVEQISEEIKKEVENEFLAEIKRSRNVPIPKPGNPRPNNPDQTAKINRLEREKQELITKNQELETQLKNSQLSPAEKTTKQQELATNKDLIKDKERELDKLRNQPVNNPTNTENNNSSKLN